MNPERTPGFIRLIHLNADHGNDHNLATARTRLRAL
jgi:hypothetical protein